MKQNKEENKKIEVLDVRKSEEERRRIGRIIKDVNFAKGSKFIPNGAEANQYRYKRKLNEKKN